jgi:hypothetical protein
MIMENSRKGEQLMKVRENLARLYKISMLDIVHSMTRKGVSDQITDEFDNSILLKQILIPEKIRKR